MTQEKMRGRSKLVPRLLRITQESIMRMDVNTKEVLKTWPLTTVRRWAASPNSFTVVGGSKILVEVLIRGLLLHIYSQSSPHTHPPPFHPSSSILFLPPFLYLPRSSPPFSSFPPSLPLLPFLSALLSSLPPLFQDFGDYSELDYSELDYSVQTTEGETISQIIGSYIDILLLTKTTTLPPLGTDSVSSYTSHGSL